MRSPKIYLLGASGVGKTVLAKYISEKWNLAHLTGATKIALEAARVSFDTMTWKLDDADRFQREVWKAQVEIEKPFWSGDGVRDPGGFVSDRSIDLVAYTAKQSRVVREIVNSLVFDEYVNRMRSAICFFVRPHPDVNAPLDGRRDRFLSKDWVYGVDGVIEFLLEFHLIPYVTIGTGSLKDRIRLVDAVISERTKE